MDISDDTAFCQTKLKVLDLRESLVESYVFVENSLNNILNDLFFAQLKVIHRSIITPRDLTQNYFSSFSPISSTNVA